MWTEFYKIQATGNDFIVTDYNNIPPAIIDLDNIKKLCNRNFGIGADGFIAIEKVEGFAFRFHYYNSDGSRGEMCANGCRAAICFAYDKSWIKQNLEFKFVADDGVHCGIFYSKEKIKLNLLIIREIEKIDISVYNLPSWIKQGYFLNSGVPHLVLICKEDLIEKPIDEYGTMLRFHKNFAPKGTNVNFMLINSDNSVFVRTFERGVEKETLSCGTGISASALVAKKVKKKPWDKIKVLTKGGELDVISRNGTTHILGPAIIVFKGQIQI